MYHSVDEPESRLERRFCCRPAEFQRQITFLLESGYNVVAMADLVTWLRQGSLPHENTVTITFDDGLECFYRNALPVLKAASFPATLFTVVNNIGGENSWMRPHGWPARRLMTREELRAAQSAGITIGCHSATHPRLTDLSDAELQHEIASARIGLADILGQDVRYFAYPYGSHGSREREVVIKAGYEAACSTRSGYNNVQSDLFSLRRIDIYGTDTLQQFRRKLEFGANRVSRLDIARYYASRLGQRISGIN